MSRLVLINGAPASGKSTLARRFAEDHPLTLVLDIDVVRGLLGRWLETPGNAGMIARRMALRMAAVQFEDGRDVVVPQFLGRPAFIEELERFCSDAGADFVETALVSSADDAVQRFARRSQHPEDATHRDAAALQKQSGNDAGVADMYRAMLDTISRRPRTRLIETTDGEIEATYQRFLTAIDNG
jgi:predicted kinase